MQLQTLTIPSFPAWFLAQEKVNEKTVDETITHIAEDGGEPADIPADSGTVPENYEPTPAENAWNELESLVHPEE